jgi:hypothetical protein
LSMKNVRVSKGPRPKYSFSNLTTALVNLASSSPRVIFLIRYLKQNKHKERLRSPKQLARANESAR